MQIYSSVLLNCDDLKYELGIKDIKFILTKNFTEDNTHASVKVNGVTGEIIQSLNIIKNIKIDFEYMVMVYENHIESFINDLCSNLTKTNDIICTSLKIACVENTLAHELKHLNQFMNIRLTEDNIDVEIDEDNHTFGFIINSETEALLEKDANEYMLYKINRTIIEDIKLKEYLTNIEYNNVLISINKKLFMEAESQSLNTDEYANNIQMYSKNVVEWFTKLNNYIKDNY
jgi:hypothetical protein